MESSDHNGQNSFWADRDFEAFCSALSVWAADALAVNFPLFVGKVLYLELSKSLCLCVSHLAEYNDLDVMDWRWLLLCFWDEISLLLVQVSTLEQTKWHLINCTIYKLGIKIDSCWISSDPVNIWMKVFVCEKVEFETLMRGKEEFNFLEKRLRLWADASCSHAPLKLGRQLLLSSAQLADRHATELKNGQGERLLLLLQQQTDHRSYYSWLSGGKRTAWFPCFYNLFIILPIWR